MSSNNKPEKLKILLEEIHGKELSNTEIREYKERLIKFILLLLEIDMRNRRKKQ